MNDTNRYLLIVNHDSNNKVLKKIKETHIGTKIEQIGDKQIGICKIRDKYTIIFIPVSDNTENESIHVDEVNNILTEKKLNKENTLVFLHGDNRPFGNNSLKKIMIPESHLKIFSGYCDYAYCILDKLCNLKRYNGKKKCEELPTWEDLHQFFKPDWADLLSQPLIPLHLALQAFWGIVSDEKNDFVRIGDRTETDKALNEYLQKIKDQGKNLLDGNRSISGENMKYFPNLKVFLLPNEAEYDFFAVIGRRLARVNDLEKYEPYEKQSFPCLVGQLFENDAITKHRDFKDEKGNPIYGNILCEKIKNLFQSENLKTLCAILSNINKDQLINPRLKSADKIEVYNTFLEESNKKPISPPKILPHTKWPKDLYDSGSEPDDSYKNLIEQLIEWNKDGEQAKKVIEQIESILFYLEQIDNFFEKEV